MSVPNPPPYAEAAVRVTLDVWACRVCGKAWPLESDDPQVKAWQAARIFDPEVAARSCHTGQRPCTREGCTELTVPHRTLCSEHLAESDAERWEKRKRVPYGGGPVWSDLLDDWFSDLGDAEDAAARRVSERLDIDSPSNAQVHEELAEMRLVVGRPVYARPVDLARQVEDLLPDDEDSGDAFLARLNDLSPLVDALNDALAKLGPVSWLPGAEAIDLDAKPVTTEAARDC